MAATKPVIAILGASGLIGQAVAEALLRDGFSVKAIARRFTTAQSAFFGEAAMVAPLAELPVADLAALIRESRAEIVVNCLGVLQDGPRGRTGDVHRDFVGRLVAALGAEARPTLLVHLSMPGRDEDDATAFSRTKREGERLIAGSGLPHVILRPGFVIAPAAYGGSALMRALATLPIAMPAADGARPFAAIAVEDIAKTITLVGERWVAGERDWRVRWELVEREPGSVADLVDSFRRRLGGPRPILPMPGWLMSLGGCVGDLVAHLGWAPPIRTTALREMTRGVVAEPRPWIAATGIEPVSREEAIRRLPGSVQERWFARLFLVKPLMLGILVVFWVLSGAIALTVAYRPAMAILTDRGFPSGLAHIVTWVSSLVDISVGLAIAHRRSCAAGLLAGIVVSLGYMGGAALLTPDLWIEPLGALVKTGPAIVLMAVAWLTLDER